MLLSFAYSLQTGSEWEMAGEKIRVGHLDYGNISYTTAQVTFNIRHNAPLFAFLLFLPGTLLSVLTVVVFLLPSDGNKIEIGKQNLYFLKIIWTTMCLI